MNTIAPATWFASSADPGIAVFLSQSQAAGSDHVVRVLLLAVVVALVALALRTVGSSLAPIVVELARTVAAASMAAVLMLAALVLVVLITVGYV